MDQKTCSWDSDDYAAHSSIQYEWARKLIEKLHLNGEESVIDIGCGDGKVTALIGSYLKNGSVTGIDSSADMIAFAQKNFSPLKYPNLTFVLQDAAKLNFKDRFDVAFSNATLHWAKDHISVLRGIKKGLKRSGRILFQMGGQGNVLDIIAAVTETTRTEKWRVYFNGFSFPYLFCSSDEYKQWLNDTGLLHVKMVRLEVEAIDP